jgi:diaminohydroxyphosphoribosylaminopyrimidine deaminase/5-amino-6-(5-phosphoribosylamino)uracil reductase
MSLKKGKFSNLDKKFMYLALNIARSRHGQTGDNPSVGCVIVKNGVIISIGQTGFNGRPHAEYNAITSSNEKLDGSKMYVTLEPCNHYGKTPPCTNQIIKNKIKEVYYSIDDIDKKVKGKTLKILRSKNILVKKGLCKNNLRTFYEPYRFNRKFKKPYVTGKIAMSKNNLIYSDGNKRITDISSDKLTHYLRYKNDSILISYKTLNKDNPKLNCRLKGLIKFSPKRIILDNKLETKISSYIFKSANKKNTIIFYNNANHKKIKLFKKKGIQLIKASLSPNKYFQLNLVLKKIYLLGCRNLLVEGGKDLSNSFLKNRLFNQFYLFKSPNKLSKLVFNKEFKSFKYLTQNYKNKLKINTILGKDSIILYKK